VIGVPALPRLVQATRRRNRIQLDEHTFIDIYEPRAKDETRGHPVVVYVHGGAWGQGESWNFSVIGVGLSETYARCTALVLSYSLYPVALMHDQVASVVLALQYARRTFPQRKIACVAHSSGAHISSLAFLRTAPDCGESGQPLADVFVAQAGVYHVARHFLFEASRCLAFVSPMLPASGGGEEPDGHVFDSVSPLCKLDGRCVLRSESMVQSTVASQLEGAVVARCMVEMTKRGVANASATSSELKTQLMPQVFVQAAVADLTVPTTSNSIPFYDKLTQSGLTNSHLLLYEGQMGHGDFIVDWLQGSKLVRREAQREFFDVGAEMQQRRKIARHVYGASARTIDTVGAGDLELGPAAHIRDLCRILENIEP
jgi:acetyl esterase/lipase